ncbi:MAG TPA: hypothetical protein VGN34_24505 [Ktedonobacteraceae bacterium]
MPSLTHASPRQSPAATARRAPPSHQAHTLLAFRMHILKTGSAPSLAHTTILPPPVAARPSIYFTEFPIPTAGATPFGITQGPDHALWFTEFDGNKIGRITTSGVITEFPIPTAGANPIGITRGPHQAIWFTELLGNKIGRITASGVSGVITEFPIPTPNSGPANIATFGDGTFGFTEEFAGQIGRITRFGQITEFRIPTPSSFPTGITNGGKSIVWFTENGANRIGRLKVIKRGKGGHERQWDCWCD